MTSSFPNAPNQLQRDLGRALTASVAPEEVPYFDEIVTASTRRGKARGDHELGFGVSADEVSTVSLAIFVSCKPVMEFLWDAARDAAGQLIKDEGQQMRLAFEKRISEWIERKLEKPSPVTATPEKLDSFLNTIAKDAQSSGLDKDTTERVVETLRNSLDSWS